MSKSNPPRSSIVARLRQSSPPAFSFPVHHRSIRRRLAIRFAALVRWVHIYLSMFGLAAVLFFSVTGITLNHPTWFFAGAQRRMQAEGRVNLKWVKPSTSDAGSSAASDPAREVAKLEVVEHLRATHKIGGALAEFRVDDVECMVSFKGPGYAADAFIDRDTGRYTLSETYQGLLAVINDLHKGRDTGPVWSVLIDISALLMTGISLTGLLMLFYLKLRRGPGLLVVLVGTAAVVAVYLFGVP